MSLSQIGPMRARKNNFASAVTSLKRWLPVAKGAWGRATSTWMALSQVEPTCVRRTVTLEAGHAPSPPFLMVLKHSPSSEPTWQPNRSNAGTVM